METRSGYGGRRQGAGRKPLEAGKKRVQMFFSCSGEQADFIRREAVEQDKTLSEYILDKIFVKNDV